MRTSFFACLLALAALCSSAVAQTSADYRLGPEDVITVTVLRHPEFSGEFLIPSDGVVDFPGAGEIHVTGRTLSEVSDLIAEGLSQRLRKPDVTVTMKATREQRIYVLGVVREPGVYDLKPGWRVTEALAAAKGVDGKPEDCRLRLIRAAGDQHLIDLPRVFLAEGGENFALGPGDVVNIEPLNLLPVYVVGQVKQPGMYHIREDTGGIMEALALAGGTLETASLSHVRITHVDGTSETIDLTAAITDAGREKNHKLVPGDLVVVPESKNRIAVLGYVNQPGYFTLRDGQKLSLSDAIGMAGGTIPRKGSFDQILILRSSDGEQNKIICNLGKFLRSGDASCNPAIEPGDVVFVPTSGSPDWDSIIRVLSSVSIFANAALY